MAERRVGLALVFALAIGMLGSCDDQDETPSAAPTASQASGPPVPIVTSPAVAAIPTRPAADPRTLASEIELVEDVIHDPSEPAERGRAAGELQQLAYRRLARTPNLMERVTPLLSRRARRSATAAVTGIRSLSVIVPAQEEFPKDWRIQAPPPPDELLGYYREAERRYGVPWGYLAAIHLVETRMSRIVGPSYAGAQGPMQFIPSTWEAYGEGDIHDTRDAIMAAARLLRANGAPGDMDNATYRYNPSSNYVAAIRSHARHMLDDPRAFYGYYTWRVFYRHVDGEFILPVGYPKARPEPPP